MKTAIIAVTRDGARIASSISDGLGGADVFLPDKFLD